MRDDEFHSTDEQRKEAERGDPVGDADDGGMPRSDGYYDSGSGYRGSSGVGHRRMVSEDPITIQFRPGPLPAVE